MRKASVGFLVRENGSGTEYLLGRRATNTFMAGFWNAPGGKHEKREGSRQCLIRELSEEVGVGVSEGGIEYRAVVDFYAPKLLPFEFEHTWRVHFFLVREWKGEPALQTPEFIKLQWFSLHSLPWHEMPPDRHTWLVPALIGSQGNNKLLKVEIYQDRPELHTVQRGSFHFTPLPRYYRRKIQKKA